MLEHPNGRTDVPGLKTAPNPDAVSQLLNTATPLSSRKGTDSARMRERTAGEGGGKKRTPSRNMTDRRSCANPKGCRRATGRQSKENRA